MMQQQTGIAALQQQPSQMPGQAPGIQQAVPQMQPHANAAPGAVQAFVGPLAQRQMPQLLQEFNNPQSQFPKFAVLAAMKDRQEKDRMQQAIQGQAAMQQAQQQQGTVADEIMAQAQQPVQAASGGMMQGYANGGAVAFTNGGSMNFEDSPEAITMDELRVQEARLAKKRAEDAAKYEFLKNAAPELAARMAEENPELQSKTSIESLKDTRNVPMPYSMPAEVAPPRSGDVGIGRALKASAGAGARVSSVPTSKPEDYDRYRRAQAEKQSAIAQAAIVPDEIKAQLQGIQALRGSSLTAEQQATKEFMESAMKRREEQVGAAKKSIFESPEALFRLAGSIDPRRGRGISSLAGGLGAELQGQRKAVAEAEDKYATSQNEARRMQSLNRALEIANAEKNYAEANGLVDRANAARQQIAGISAEMEKTIIDFQDKAKGRNIESLKAEAALSSAAAARTSNEQARLGQLLRSIEQNKLAAVEKVTEAIDKKYEMPLRMIRIKQMSNQPLSEAEQAQEQAYKAELNAARGNASKFFDAQRGKVEETLYGGPITPQDQGTRPPPPVGKVIDGYRFKGGNPSDKNNWEKV